MSYIPSTQVPAKISTDNSTTATLGANATYSGTSEDVSSYSQITVFYDSDVSGSTSGLRMEFSTDGTNWDRAKTITPLIDASQTAYGGVHTLVVISKFFRVIYTNGATAQSHFRLQTIYHPTKNKELTSTMNQTLNEEIDVQNVRSVIVGQDAAGNFRNVPIDHEAHLFTSINDPLTSFGELKIAEGTPIVNIAFNYNINESIVTTGATTGSGNVSQTQSMAKISTGTNSGSTGDVRSIRKLKYYTGEGCLTRFTCIFDSGTTNSVQIAGAGDEDDGVFFAKSGQTFGLIKRRNQIDEFIPQTDFNFDKLDGSSNLTNPSGMLIDETKGNVYQIKYQWLGFGSIIFMVESPSSGTFFPVHKFEYANANTIPSMFNPVFPLIFQAKNNSDATDVTMYTSSSAGQVEGKRVLTGPVFAESNTASSSSNTNILTLKNNTTFAGKTNKVEVFPRTINLVADGNQAVTIDIYKNPVLAGESYSDVQTNQSVMQIDTSGTYTSGGTKLYSFGLAKSDSLNFKLTDFEFGISPGDVISIISNGTNASVTAAVNWVEDF